MAAQQQFLVVQAEEGFCLDTLPGEEAEDEPLGDLECLLQVEIGVTAL